MAANKIMIVEDNTTVAEDYRDCLESFGYIATSVVASGEESVVKAEIDRPDAVIMDIQLRDKMDGITAADQIYSRFNIPVIFLSAFCDDKLLDRAKNAGSFAYLVKPFNESELHATLEIVLHKSKTEIKTREMEAQIRQAQKMEGLNVMANSITRNFNNILHAVKGYTDMGLHVLSKDAESRNLFLESQKALAKAIDLSQLLLVYVGAENNNKKLTVDLSSLVQTSLKHVQGMVPQNIGLSEKFAENELKIEADVEQLDQIISSLIINSVEAIDGKGGKIIVRTLKTDLSGKQNRKEYFSREIPPGNYCVLEIADSGCGMEKNVLDRVLDPFFSTKFASKGLGLSTTLGIARGHQGFIAIKSKPGEGATFTIFFPEKI
ncbi:MAG: response regulator [Proteobacteria bacterium]|nr:response regulator [Pseudomonadota bacterium]